MGEIGAAHGVVVPRRIGEVSRADVRDAHTHGIDWRVSSRGRFMPTAVALTPAQRVVEAGVLVPRRGAVTGWGSLAWQRARWFEGLRRGGTEHRPVDVAVPRRLIRPQPLIAICEERFDPTEVVVDDGLRIANAVRAVCFEMRYAPNLWLAVRALDMAAYDDLVSIDEVALWAARHPSYTGIDQCRRAVPLGDENAWSPMEVDQRLDWMDAVGRRPLTNRPVFDLEGRHIGTPDLIDPKYGVLGQYDGALHLQGSRRAADLELDGTFRAHGLHPVTMVAADRRDPGAYHERLRHAYRAAQRQPVSERSWTLELPSWWVPTWTVSQRRRLTQNQRERWLGYRVG
jgi:hypothetical protein